MKKNSKTLKNLLINYFKRLSEVLNMLRKGLKTINVNETVEFELSYYNANKFKKLQFSGFLNENKDEYWYLPTHQGLVDELVKIPRGSLVRATRTNLSKSLVAL